MSKIHYLDLIGGSNDADGLSFATRRKDVVDVTNLDPGDEIRYMASNDPVAIGNTATWTQGSSAISLDLDHIPVADLNSGTWSNNSGTWTSDITTTKISTSSSRLAIGEGTTGRIAHAVFSTTLNLAPYSRICLWIRNQSTIAAGQISLVLYSDSSATSIVGSFPLPAIPSTYHWYPVVLETGTLPFNVASISFVVNTAFYTSLTMNVDNIVACLPAVSGGITLSDLIGKPNSIGAGGDDSETWYAIAGFVGNQIYIDANPESSVLTRPGYYGTTETVEIWLRDPIQTTPATDDNAIVYTVENSGQAGLPIAISFGWNQDGMNIQSSQTWLDGVNGAGIAFMFSSVKWVNFQGVGLVRYFNALSTSSILKCHLSLISASHNNGDAIRLEGSSANNVIDIDFGHRNGDAAFTDHVLGGFNNINLGKVYSNLGYGLEIAHNDTVRGGTVFGNAQAAFHTVGTAKIYDVHTKDNASGTGESEGFAISTSATSPDGGTVGSYVHLAEDLSSILNGSTSSMTAFFKTTSVGGSLTFNTPSIFGVEHFGFVDDIFWGNLTHDGKICISVGDTFVATSLAPVNDGVWHHLVLTRDMTSGLCQVFIDGIFQASGTGALSSGPYPITDIGRVQIIAGTAPSNFWTGGLDDVRIYNRVLTPLEVTQVAQAFTGSPDVTSGLLHRWQFSEGAGTTTADSAGTNTGTLDGANWISGVGTVGTGSSANGLLATYFNSNDFTGLTYTRIDPNIDFAWDMTPPAPGFGNTNWTARWEGKIQPLYSEPYRFYAHVDDGCRVWVNGILLIDQFISEAPTEVSATATIDLIGGQLYDIRVDYVQFNPYQAQMTMIWSSPSQAKETIPASRFFHGVNSSAAIWVNPSCSAGYTVTVYNSNIEEEVECGGFTALQDARVAFHNHDGVKGKHLVVTDGGTIANEDGADRHTPTGFAWKLSPNSGRTSDYPLDFRIASIGVLPGRTVTVSGWMKTSDSAITAKLVIPGGQIDGVDTDVVVSGTAIGSYEQLSMTFTPTEQGVVDIYARAYGGTSSNVWVDDLSVVQS